MVRSAQRRCVSSRAGLNLSASRRSCSAGAGLSIKQALLYLTVAATPGVDTIRIRYTGTHAREQGHHLVCMGGRVDTELTTRHGLAHIGAQHQVTEIGVRHDYALPAGQAARIADIEEALDLFVHPTNRLDLTMLVDRAGDRQRLVDREVTDRRKQGAQLAQRGTVALHRSI